MKAHAWWLLLTGLALAGCPKKEESETPMSLGEASQAVEEASLDGQASTVTANTIEISTTFTIGAAVEKAAEEIKSFIETQLPCAEITLAAGKLSVEYGTRPGACVYRGQTYKGTHTIEVVKTAPGEIEVRHAWIGMSNQRVKVDGSATVTWSASAMSRRVQHELTWTRLSDGRSGKGTGDRTQTPLGGGLAEGIKIDGARSWTGERGTWDLAIRGVEARWVDPVPQAGSYTLLAPSKRSMTLAFSRVDADTIRVTVSSGARAFNFEVSSVGDVRSGS